MSDYDAEQTYYMLKISSHKLSQEWHLGHTVEQHLLQLAMELSLHKVHLRSTPPCSTPHMHTEI
jgi:hypothetical protein